ncbi:MAG TPA: GtrA family protein [Candidatus Alectryocaccomicrobium excrementavium]|uniref:GtrA family protein n=1 Tax=Candidatus Alectryocaccomicrobium excrementavium TaxID=2840668 RepID=A0A9D1FY64_9FIRM|nr:GtrA family protein [Candidatus Alectryocaccomicrobium excrementavium]
MKNRVFSLGVCAAILLLFSAAAYACLLAIMVPREALAVVALADLGAAVLMAFRFMWRRPGGAAFMKYMLIGVATTAVNYVCYWLLAHPLRQALGIEAGHTAWVALSTAVSWLAAVVFSFFPNKTYAFGSHDWSRRTLIREGRTFFLSRLLTFAFDLVFMMIAVPLGMHDMVAKIFSNIVVVIGNFVTSKLIFLKKPGRQGAS